MFDIIGNTSHMLSDEEYAARLNRLSLFGFQEDPFSLSADPRYLYLGSEHATTYRQLQSVIMKRRGLALLTGDMGAGKSSIARRLYTLYLDNPAYVISYIDTGSFKTPMVAARNIANAFPTFGIAPQRSYDRQIEALKRAIVDATERNKNVVLLLDDAQRMHPDALEAIHELYNFDFDQKLIQIILFGQFELDELVASYPAVYSRVFIKPRLDSLSIQSTLEMINFRVRTAGRREPFIDDEAIQLLFVASEGIPRNIVRLCALATDLVMEREEKLITREIMVEVLGLRI
jgi:general secretion pathway protein A